MLTEYWFSPRLWLIFTPRLQLHVIRFILFRCFQRPVFNYLESRSTTLSYGNMGFSGTCPAETTQQIKIKFCKIDDVGGVTRCAKNGCNQLAGGGPTNR
jgi:hypothetical protein